MRVTSSGRDTLELAPALDDELPPGGSGIPLSLPVVAVADAVE